MSRAIVDNLNNLLPTCNGLPPPELVELALCLLAQSRSQANNLKAEEEIARSYTCAHLACERSKQTMKSIKIQPRPPCQPRVYQNLYRHFDAALSAGTVHRDRASKTEERTARSSSRIEALKTPVAQSQVNRRDSRKRTQRNPNSPIEMPQWMMPVIRQLCEATGRSAAPPHIFAGVSSIVGALRDTNYDGEVTTATRNISALIVSIYLFVVLRLTGKEIQSDDYIEASERALQIINAIKVLEGKKENATTSDVDAWLLDIHNNGWASLDWYRNIPCENELRLNDGAAEVGETEAEHPLDREKPFTRSQYLEDTEACLAILRPGLGTMMQDAVNFLSPARRKNYALWKAKMLSQIEGRRSQCRELEIT